MNKRKKIIIIVFCCLAIVLSFVLFREHSSNGKMVKTKNRNENIVIYSMREPFRLIDIITGKEGKVNNCILQGKIIDIETYEVSWIDNSGEKWGPDDVSIISVELSRDLLENKNCEKQTIKILYPFTLSNKEQDTVVLKKGQEYVFANCWYLDDAYFNYARELDPSCAWENDPSLKAGDAISGAAWCSVFPVEDGVVYLYHEYIDKTPDIAKKVLPADQLKTSLLTSENAFTSGDFIALSYSDFNNLIQALINY